MANPRGQQRDKPFRDALRLEIAAAQDEDNPRSLRQIARKLLEQAATGDVQAVKEVADRLDGKVPQGVIGGDEDDPAIVIETIKRLIIDPISGNTDSESVPPAA